MASLAEDRDVMRGPVLLVFAILVVAISPGCRTHRAPGYYTLGPYTASSEAALFDSVVRAIRGNGYDVRAADPERGLIAASGDGANFAVRLYREGWIAIEPQVASTLADDRSRLAYDLFSIRLRARLAGDEGVLAGAPLVRR